MVASLRDSSSMGKFIAQILAHLAADFAGVRDQLIERLILIEPFGGGLRADAGDAGNVVRAVADQRQIVDDLFGKHVEFGLDAGAIEARIAHGVDSPMCGPTSCAMSLSPVEISTSNPLRRPVSPACRSRRRLRRRRRAAAAVPWRRPRRSSGCTCERRSSGMGCAMRLVLLEQIVAERAARRIEHHRDAIRRFLLDHLVEHVEHAQHRAGRLTRELLSGGSAWKARYK
jgi:hypothetical protein